MVEHTDTDNPRSEELRGEKSADLEIKSVESDVDFEPEDEVGGMVALRAKMQKVKLELERCKKESKEYLDGWQRCKADTINMRRETVQMLERGTETLKENFFTEMIPVLDSFDAASGGSAWKTVDVTWKRGMEQVHNQLLDVCGRHGIKRYGKIGDTVDHTLHDVVEEQDGVSGQSGEVVCIVRYGYRAGDKVIRPAQVIVKK